MAFDKEESGQREQCDVDLSWSNWSSSGQTGPVYWRHQKLLVLLAAFQRAASTQRHHWVAAQSETILADLNFSVYWFCSLIIKFNTKNPTAKIRLSSHHVHWDAIRLQRHYIIHILNADWPFSHSKNRRLCSEFLTRTQNNMSMFSLCITILWRSSTAERQNLVHNHQWCWFNDIQHYQPIDPIPTSCRWDCHVCDLYLRRHVVCCSETGNNNNNDSSHPELLPYLCGTGCLRRRVTFRIRWWTYSHIHTEHKRTNSMGLRRSRQEQVCALHLWAVHQSVGWWPPSGRGEAAGSSRCWRSRSGCVSWRSAAPRVDSASPEQQTSDFFYISLLLMHILKSDTNLQPFLQEALASLQTVWMLVGVTPVSDQEHQRLNTETRLKPSASPATQITTAQTSGEETRQSLSLSKRSEDPTWKGFS